MIDLEILLLSFLQTRTFDLTKLMNGKHFLELSQYQIDELEETGGDENRWVTNEKTDQTMEIRRESLQTLTLPLWVSATHRRSWTRELSSNGSN